MWMKIDDRLHAHRKTRLVLRSDDQKARDASPMGLWVLAGSWAAQNATEGWIPVDELERFDADWDALSKRLVAADYWWPEQRDGEDGFGFVDWQEWNGRDRESEHGKFGNHKRWHLDRGIVKDDCDHCPKDPESPPDRPPISPPIRGGESGQIAHPYPIPSQSQSHPEATRKRGSQLPKDWKPTSEHQSRALAAGLVLGREVDKFKAHAEENARVAKNWNAAFTRWLINAEEYAGRNATTTPRATLPHASQLEDPPPGLDAEQYDAWFREQVAKRKAGA